MQQVCVGWHCVPVPVLPTPKCVSGPSFCMQGEDCPNCNTATYQHQTCEFGRGFPGNACNHDTFSFQTYEAVRAGKAASCKNPARPCCIKHQSRILWCDLALHPDWNIDSTTHDNPERATDCVTQSWQVRGDYIQWSISNECGIIADVCCVVIWGHNLHMLGGSAVQICDKSGNTIQPENYQFADVPIYPVKRKQGGMTGQPVVICFDQLKTDALQVKILTPATEFDWHIDTIAVLGGIDVSVRKNGFVNSVSATRRERSKSRRSGSGFLRTTTRSRDIPQSLVVKAPPQYFESDEWLELMEYAPENIVYFQWSSKARPTQILRGYIQPVDGHQCTTGNRAEVNLEIIGERTQRG